MVEPVERGDCRILALETVMKHVLLTGFEPFGEHKVNPSQQIAERLNGETIAGARITSLVLPVAFGKDTAQVLPAIEELEPALVLSLGLAAGRSTIDVEMFAINHRNAGQTGILVPIIGTAQPPISRGSTTHGSPT